MTPKTSASDVFEDLDPEEGQEFRDRNRRKDREYDLVELNNYKIIKPEYEALEGIAKEYLNNYNDPEEYFSEDNLDVRRGHAVSIDLSFHGLPEIPEYINDLKELEELDLHGNKISNIENLDNLKNLQWLDLFYNQISEIDNLGDLKNLERLNLSYNQISEIENLDDLKNLQELYLLDNQISKIDNLDNLKNLEALYLVYNSINYSNPRNREKLEELEERGVDVVR